MMYPQAQGRDRITEALMAIQHPPPQMQMPDIGALGQGMNFPAVATPGTVASMNSQGPASPSYPGVQALQGQPQAFPPMQGPSPPLGPGMPAPGAPPTQPPPGAGLRNY